MNAEWDSPWVGERVESEPAGEGNVDDLLDSLGLNSEDASPQRMADANDQPDGVRSSRIWAPLAILLGLGLVVAIGAVIWALGSDSEGTDAGLETITTEAAPEADVEGEAQNLRDILSGLSLGDVAVEVREAKIHLTGSVASEQDLTTIRNAVISASDPALVNMNEIEVGGPAYQQAPPPPAAGQAPPPPGGPPPGAPPPGFVPPTPEQRANLQSELDRVLTATPLVFDPGSTELNELQLTVLDTTVIGLLESHPGVPVRLVGYTDDQGEEYDNSLLSFARAEAVRSYLISRGVPEFILRAEGRGEDAASGDRGADRRVEIEVIEGP